MSKADTWRILHRGAIALNQTSHWHTSQWNPMPRSLWNAARMTADSTHSWLRILLRRTNISKSHGIRSRTYRRCSYLPALYHLQHKDMPDCRLVLFGWTLPCGMLTLNHVTMFPFVLPRSFCCTAHCQLLITHSHVITCDQPCLIAVPWTGSSEQPSLPHTFIKPNTQTVTKCI